MQACLRVIVGFLKTETLCVGSLVTYHLVVYGGVSTVSFSGIKLTDTKTIRRVFLILTAALLAVAACVGYLRRLQREVFDYLSIFRYRILGRDQGCTSYAFQPITSWAFSSFVIRGACLERSLAMLSCILKTWRLFNYTIIYIGEAIRDLRIIEHNDLLLLVASGMKKILCVRNMIVEFLGGRTRIGLTPMSRSIGCSIGASVNLSFYMSFLIYCNLFI